MKNFYCKQKQNQENSVTLKARLLSNYTHKRRRPNPSTKKPNSWSTSNSQYRFSFSLKRDVGVRILRWGEYQIPSPISSYHCNIRMGLIQTNKVQHTRGDSICLEKSCSKFKRLFGWIFFITQFPSLNFHHSLLITHHSSLKFSHPFGTITHFPSLNIFHTICGLIPVTRCNFFFSFSFFPIPKLTEPREKNKIK